MTMTTARPTQTPTLLPQGTMVRILEEDGPPIHSGRIVGFGTITGGPGVQGGPHVLPVYLVQLERGFHSEDRSCYVGILSVHPDNVDTDVPFCTAHQAHNCPFDED